MKQYLSKKTAIAIFCYCGQGRASVDHVLSSPSQWMDFVEFYDEQKRHAVASLNETLKRAGAVQTSKVDRRSFSQSIFSALTCHTVGRVLNKTRNSWAFSQDELSFICSTLEQLLEIIKGPKPQDFQKLIDLRMDLHICQEIIDWKLIGVPELRKAEKIEHFNQSDYLEHVSLQEMGVHTPQRVDGKIRT